MRLSSRANADVSPNALFRSIRPWINASAAWVSRIPSAPLASNALRMAANRSALDDDFIFSITMRRSANPRSTERNIRPRQISIGRNVAMGQLFKALADLHYRHHRQHSRNGHQDDEHNGDTHDLSLDRQPDHGAILFKEWPSLKSFRRFHPTAPGRPQSSGEDRQRRQRPLPLASLVACRSGRSRERRRGCRTAIFLVQHMSLDLAQPGTGAMSDLSPLSGVERKLDSGDVRAAVDPQRRLAFLILHCCISIYSIWVF